MSGLPMSRPLFATSTHFVEWWDSRPLSALKDYVLLLITMVMGTGSVERFFSFAKYTDTEQRHGLDAGKLS